MSRRSSISLTYKDLVAYAEKQKGYQERRLEIARACNENCEHIAKDLECVTVLARMLKKCEPGRQADLFQIFQSISK